MVDVHSGVPFEQQIAFERFSLVIGSFGGWFSLVLTIFYLCYIYINLPTNNLCQSCHISYLSCRYNAGKEKRLNEA